MLIDCPICETKILNSDSKNCQQCGSDLEVYSLVEKLQEKSKEIEGQTKSLPSVEVVNMHQQSSPALATSTNTTQKFTYLIVVLCVLVLCGIFFSNYQFQNILLEELHQERILRQNSESKNAKITEKLIEKNAEAYSINLQTVNSFTELNKSQQESIQKLNLKISELEKALTKKRFFKGRSSR